MTLQKHLRNPVNCAAIYAFLILANGLLYYFWSGDLNGMPRCLGRSLAILLLCYYVTYGKDEKWFPWIWWTAAIVSPIFIILGFGSLLSFIYWGDILLRDRPYPVADIGIMVLTTVSIVWLFITLLLRENRDRFLRPNL